MGDEVVIRQVSETCWVICPCSPVNGKPGATVLEADRDVSVQVRPGAPIDDNEGGPFSHTPECDRADCVCSPEGAE